MSLRPLKFHRVHGQNVSLTPDERTATRSNSFCKAVAFSNRPILVDETVCIRIAVSHSDWNGVLRLGITNTDPTTLEGNVKKYVCPDMAEEDGCWAKAWKEDGSCAEGNILFFFVRESGEMYAGVNGTLQGLFLSGVNTQLPMYVVVDIYGNTLSIEFLDELDVPSCRNQSPAPQPQRTAVPTQSRCDPPLLAPSTSAAVPQSSIVPQPYVRFLHSYSRDEMRQIPFVVRAPPAPVVTDFVPSPTLLAHMAHIPNRPLFTALTPVPVPPPIVPTPPPIPNPQELLQMATPLVPVQTATTSAPIRPTAVQTSAEQRRYSFNRNEHELLARTLQERNNFSRNQREMLLGPSQNSASTSASTESSLRFHHGPIVPMQFHNIAGLNTTVNADRTIASRSDTHGDYGYVFTCRSIRPYEKVIIQIQHASGHQSYGLSVGVTNCDPIKLNNYVFPEDSDEIMFQRQEFWAISKDLGGIGAPATNDELGFYIDVEGNVRVQKNEAPPSFLFSVDKDLVYYMVFNICGSTRCIRLAGCMQPRSAPVVTNSSGQRSAPNSNDWHHRMALLQRPPSQQPPSQQPPPEQALPQQPLSQQMPSQHQPPQRARLPFFSSAVPRQINSLVVSLPPPAPPKVDQPMAAASSVAAASDQSQPSTSQGANNGANPANPVQAAAAANANASPFHDCCICNERPTNCSVYPCGHVFMCYECGRSTWSRQGVCPICRVRIKDIVRLYVSGSG